MKGKTMEPSERMNEYDKKKADKKAKMLVQIKLLFESVHEGIEGISNGNDDQVDFAVNQFYDAMEALSEVPG